MALILSSDKLLNLNRELLRENKYYKSAKLFVSDRAADNGFGIAHNCNVRLAGQYYRAGIYNGAYSAGDREMVYHFLSCQDMSESEFIKKIQQEYDSILAQTKIGISSNVVACAMMELYMDDVLDNQIMTGQYVALANKFRPTHRWRFATPEEYAMYNFDFVEEHHNGKIVAVYQVERSTRYYEWLADPAKNGMREWVKNKLDTNLICATTFVQKYNAPYYMLAYQHNNVMANKALIYGKVDRDGSISVGKEIPREIFVASHAATV